MLRLFESTKFRLLRPVLLALMLAYAAGLTSAGAQSTGSKALSTAEQALRDQNFKAAIKHTNRAFDSDKLSSAELARALYVRGAAHFDLQRPAQAISDLTSAIWTKKLPAALQKKAGRMRAEAYANAGIAKPTRAVREPGRNAAIKSTTTTVVSSAPPISRSPIARPTNKVAPAPVHSTPKPHKVSLPTSISAPLPIGMAGKRARRATQSIARVKPKAAPKPANTVRRAQRRTWATSSVQNLPAAIHSPKPVAWAKPTVDRNVVRAPATRTPIATTPPASSRRTAPATSPMKTGSIAPQAEADVTTVSPKQQPAKTTAAASATTQASVQSAKLEPKKAQSNSDSGNILGNLFGLIEQNEETPAVALANELQRRRREQILEHNRRLAGTAQSPPQ